MFRFLIVALSIFPISSWGGPTQTCTHALEIWANKGAPMSEVIPALKIGARDGDAGCAAFVGVALSNIDYGRESNYSTDPREGYRYLKQAALDSYELAEGIKKDVFYWLGRAYFDGKPVLQNFKIAYSWFSLAAALDDARSSAMRDRTFYMLRQAGLADGVQEFAVRCKSSPKLCLPE